MSICALCAAKLWHGKCFNCPNKAQKLVFKGEWSSEIHPTLQVEIVYNVSGTNHSGYCSGAELNDIEPHQITRKVPIISELFNKDHNYHSFVNIIGKYAVYYEPIISCENGSGVCGAKTLYEIDTYRVIPREN